MKQFIKKNILKLIFIILVFSPLYSLEWFVSPLGDDHLNDGSMDKPFNSIQKALNSAQAGDLISLSEGNYFRAIRIRKDSITIRGTLDNEGKPLSRLRYLRVQANDFSLANCEIDSAYVILDGSKRAHLQNNIFTGKANFNLVLRGAVDSFIEKNIFSSARYYSVYITYDRFRSGSHGNTFLLNQFNHPENGSIRHFVFTTWARDNFPHRSLSYDNLFDRCDFVETKESKVAISVIQDNQTWWMTAPEHRNTYSMKFKNCFYKKTSGIQTTVTDWISRNNGYALKGRFAHTPARLQITGFALVPNFFNQNNDEDEKPEVEKKQADIYVDEKNRGIENGSFEHPFSTIVEALEEAVEGDVIQVAAGKYFHSLHIEKNNIILRGTLDSNCDPLSKIGSISVRGDYFGLQDFEIVNAGLTLDSARNGMIEGNIFSGKTFHSVTLSGAVDNEFRHNTFSSGVLATLFIKFDTSLNGSHGNTFISNQFLPIENGNTRFFVYSVWRTPSRTSINYDNLFVNCNFMDREMNGRIYGSVILDEQVAWMTRPDEKGTHSVKLQNCYFEKEGIKQNSLSEWISPNNQGALTGQWGLPPRVQVVGFEDKPFETKRPKGSDEDNENDQGEGDDSNSNEEENDPKESDLCKQITLRILAATVGSVPMEITTKDLDALNGCAFLRGLPGSVCSGYELSTMVTDKKAVDGVVSVKVSPDELRIIYSCDDLRNAFIAVLVRY